MAKRLALSALVGLVTFVVVYIVVHWAYPHDTSKAAFLGLVDGSLFGAINATVAFGVMTIASRESQSKS